MQRLWLEGLDWDDVLPPTCQVSWANFFKETNELNHVMFERFLTPDDVIRVPSSLLMHLGKHSVRVHMSDGKLPIMCLLPDLSRQNPE